MVSKFERAAALPKSDVAELAQMAALAMEYAIKAEAGTATEVDLFSLTCHCSTLADDLYDLAVFFGSAVAVERPPARPLAECDCAGCAARLTIAWTPLAGYESPSCNCRCHIPTSKRTGGVTDE